MDVVKSAPIEMLSRRSIVIKDFNIDNEENDNDVDRNSLKMDLSMGEQFYYEIISSFEQEEVFTLFVSFINPSNFTTDEKWSLVVSGILFHSQMDLGNCVFSHENLPTDN